MASRANSADDAVMDDQPGQTEQPRREGNAADDLDREFSPKKGRDQNLSSTIEKKFASYKQSIQEITKSIPVMLSASLVVGFLAIAFTIFIIHLGVYGYVNPDPEHAYYVDGIEQTAIARNVAEQLAKDKGVEVRHGYPVDIARLFRSWFVWGFWSHILFLVIQIVFVPLFLVQTTTQTMYKVIYSLLTGVKCCNFVAWFLMGFFWRFSRAGRIASGEKIQRGDLSDDDWAKRLDEVRDADGYQLKGGKFMSIFVYVILGVLFTAIAAGSVTALRIFLSKGEQQEYEKLMRARQQEDQPHAADAIPIQNRRGALAEQDRTEESKEQALAGQAAVY